jgi:carbamoyltransferase
MNILGISAFYHDSAAALVQDGRIVAAAQEERFTRKKHDHRFPIDAARYCLKEAGLSIKDIDYVGFYDKPLRKFERLIETYLAFAPAGIQSFLKAMPLWLKQKLHLPKLIRDELGYDGPIIFGDHHESHAASAFFASPFQDAALLTLDGVGEWTTTSFGEGSGNRIRLTHEIRFPHSLGMLYSAFTYYCGFRVNSGEYKLMGLAPYGQPKYVDRIYRNLIDLKPDGSFWLDLSYFNYCQGLTMTGPKFHALFGGPPRPPETPPTQKDMDLAASIQVVTEDVMLRCVKTVHDRTGFKNLCMAGGVALNCVANGRILREGPFENLWIQPAAGDAGGALGVALFIWYQLLDNPRQADGKRDAQFGSYLGPAYSADEIQRFLDAHGCVYERVDEEQELLRRVADLIARENVIGWFQGRMEFGPRALGARSIIGDPRSSNMQSTMNLKIKFRESFRPFAPSVLREKVSDWFELDCDSPYMLLVANVVKERRKQMTEEQQALFGIEKLKVLRSDIPAVTHVDYSARIQTVDHRDNPLYHALLAEFSHQTGCDVLVNTSFNVRGEPIVCTPQDAYLCFMRTHIDVLVLGPFILDKTRQKPLEGDADWRKLYVLD